MCEASSDYWLVFGSDLDWHLAAGRVDTERLVALQLDRDEFFAIAERLRLAEAVYYVGVDAWTRDSNGLLVRRDVASQLGGT